MKKHFALLAALAAALSLPLHAFTYVGANGENVSAANFKTALALGLVENTALSTWAGSSSITTVGTLVTPNLGTPSAVVLTNATGLPVTTGISGLASGVASFLSSPSTGNLAVAVTGETGTGALVFGTSPTFFTPILGTPTSGTLTSCTGLPIVGGTTGTLSVARGGTGVTTSTGTGNLVLATSPELVTPALGTPSAAVLTNATGLPLATGITGLGTGISTFLATPSSANLATAITDETGTGSAVFATSPTLVTPALGVAAATSINKLTLTAPATGSTLTIADGKTLTASSSITLAGTDGTTMTFPTVTSTLARTSGTNTFTGVQSMTSPDITTSLTTPSTTFSLLTTTATTINAFNAATTLNLGANNTTAGATTLGAGTVSSGTKTIGIGTQGQAGSTTNITLGTGSGGTSNITLYGKQLITAQARTSGTANYFQIIGASDTGITASTESIGFVISGVTRTWEAGSLTTQRERVFGANTIAFDSASTVTTAINADFADPVAGTNATLTNKYAVRAESLRVTNTIDLANSDTTIARVSAGRISVEGVNIPTISSTDTLTNKTLTYGIVSNTTVGALTAAATAGLGSTMVVTDALAPAAGATVAAGGAAKALVMSNGTNWIVVSTL